MKLRIAVLVLVMVTGIMAGLKAQNKIGIRAGYQNTSFRVDGSKVDDTDYYHSFYVGFFKEHKIVPVFHVGYGLDYNRTGQMWNSKNDKVVLNNLSVPVYLKAKLGPVFAVGGVAPSFKISEKYSDNHTDSPFGDDKYKTLSFPLFGGVGVKILMFTIEGRYYWGLNEINNGVKNQYVQLGAGISF